MACAAITSLMSTILQSMQVTACNLKSFYEKLETLRLIMEKPCNIIGDIEALTSLEEQITDLAYRAEDMVDLKSTKILRAKTPSLQSRAFGKLCCFLEQAVERIDSVMELWIEIRKGYTPSKDIKAQNLTLASTSQQAVETENKMVGYENEFMLLQDLLARGTGELEVVSIVGTGGIGKSTLANKIYSDPFIISRFDIRAKATVSQDYCARNVLLGLLSSIGAKTDELYREQDDEKLADQLQKLLKARRYLIVIDDIWTKGAWDDIKLCLPDYNCGSRILITTRNMEVAEYARSGKPPYQMRLMNFEESWSLLYDKVFVNECFSPEFEQLGKQIALKCRGLPLTIIVIAGLLSKIGKALSEWQIVAKNVSSVVRTDVDVQCMRVLALSYHHLPHHLKLCFLYFAIFPEDKLIFVDKLAELWLAEGFLMVEGMNSIEVAEKCLKELTDRCLIFIHHLSFDGKIKACGMHDVIHELCLREARNMNFLNIMEGENYSYQCAQSVHFPSKRRGRISVQDGKELARSHISEARSIFIFYRYLGVTPQLSRFKLVRVLDLALWTCFTFPSWILDLIHLRYLALSLSPGLQSYIGVGTSLSVDIPPSISSLCYLQTFILKFRPSDIVSSYPFILPSEILTMPQLRHLCLDWNYLRYQEPTEKSLVPKNLQCISGWNPFYCTASVLRLMPNVKKLHICGVPHDYRCRNNDEVLQDLSYLDQLHELKFQMKIVDKEGEIVQRVGHPGRGILKRFSPVILPPPGAFPQNLKKLAFSGTSLQWKDLSIVGKLPKLESLKLAYDACVGDEWEVVEESFPCLKFLVLKHLGIRYWRASGDHFPCLQRLFLKACWCLDSIPQDFAEISTLELLDICGCAESVGNSAKQIQQDTEDNYGASVEVRIS